VIITVALTGAVPEKSRYPSLPITTEEIATTAIACADAGAAIVHLHMRDDQGKQTQDKDQLIATMRMIRAVKPELIICATTTSRGASGILDRLVPLSLPSKELPELASLTMGSYNTPYGVNLNPTDEIEMLAAEMMKVGVKPELEIFEPGMLYNFFRMKEKNQISQPAMINILLGVEGACPANERELKHLVELVPPDIEWAVAGIGKHQKQMVELGISIGGNVRVGMEDNPRGYRENWTNVDAVEMAVEIATEHRRSVATVAEARIRLGL
jgi:3-keto-5-aminohexanoate cleavage enzyme